ncbi:MAG: NAD-dependent epimerase/dehydratase family protein [Burkholderiales bacterium]
MHALVTGVGGFIGRHLAAAFLGAGWRVTGVLRSAPGVDLPPGLAVVRTDLREPRGLPDAYDLLVHCAAEIPAHCPDPELLYAGNVAATGKLLEHAAAAGARRALYMSSMAVYGPIDAPVVDEQSALKAADAYGRSKAEGERLAAAWAARCTGGAISLRLPGIVGAGSHDNFLSDALAAIRAGRGVAARNPGGLFNNVVHVDELAAFAVHLAGHMPAGHAALTLGADEPLPVSDVLARLAAAAGRPLRVEWKPGEGKSFLIGFERARALGFRPASVADSVARFGAGTTPA